MPPESVMILSPRLSQRESSRSTFSRWAGSGARPKRPRLKETVFQTVSNMSVCSSCGTSPIIARVTRYSRRMSCPSTSTWPEVGVTIPHTMLMSVVLPAPLGPSRAKISPLRISRSTLFRAFSPEA